MDEGLGKRMVIEFHSDSLKKNFCVKTKKRKDEGAVYFSVYGHSGPSDSPSPALGAGPGPGASG